MYSHLSKKEKRKKLAQVRKRAIIWSAQQQTVAALKKSLSEKPKQLTPTASYKTKQDTAPPPNKTFYTPLSLPEDSVDTIQAIQQTLLDLHHQHEAIDITIYVHSNFNFPSLKRDRRKIFYTLYTNSPKARTH